MITSRSKTLSTTCLQVTITKSQVSSIQYPSPKPSTKTKSSPFPHHHQLWVVDHLHSLSIFISGMAPSQDFSGKWRFSPGFTDLHMYCNVILVVKSPDCILGGGTYPMFVCIYSSTQFFSRFLMQQSNKNQRMAVETGWLEVIDLDGERMPPVPLEKSRYYSSVAAWVSKKDFARFKDLLMLKCSLISVIFWGLCFPQSFHHSHVVTRYGGCQWLLR